MKSTLVFLIASFVVTVFGAFGRGQPMVRLQIYAAYAVAAALYVTITLIFLRHRAKGARAKLGRLAAGELCFHCDSEEVKPHENGIVCCCCGQLSTHELIGTPLFMSETQMRKLHRPAFRSRDRYHQQGAPPPLDTCLGPQETQPEKEPSFTRIKLPG